MCEQLKNRILNEMVAGDEVTITDIQLLIDAFTNNDEPELAYPLASAIWGYLVGKGVKGIAF